MHRHPILRPSPHNSEDGSQPPPHPQAVTPGKHRATRGPFVPRAAVTGTRRSHTDPTHWQRRPKPAATGGSDHARRGCQWIPDQVRDDVRGEASARAFLPPGVNRFRLSTDTPSSGRHPGQGEAATRGPFVPRAAVTGTRRSHTDPTHWQRRPKPAATGGSDHALRGCQWIPDQVRDDVRGEASARAFLPPGAIGSGSPAAPHAQAVTPQQRGRFTTATPSSAVTPGKRSATRGPFVPREAAVKPQMLRNGPAASGGSRAGCRGATRLPAPPIALSRTCPCTCRAARSSGSCPSCCAAVREARRRAWAA